MTTSISLPTKRVTSSVIAFLCVSFQTTSLLALMTRTARQQQSPSSCLLQTLRRRQQQPQRQRQKQRRVSSHRSAAVLTAKKADVTTTTKENMTQEEQEPLLHDERTLIQEMLSRIRDCNQMPDDLQAGLIEFQVDGIVLGKVDPKVTEILCATSVVLIPGGSARAVFQMVTPLTNNSQAFLTLSEAAAGTTLESRTQAVAMVMEELKETNIVTGWRDELYPVSDSFYNPPFFLMERAATDLLGVLSYGVHINGILHDTEDVEGKGTGTGNGTVEKHKNNQQQLPLMWMARRSHTKSTYPNMLDQIVAGGQPAGLSLMNNVLKECVEEAGIPADIAMLARPAGVVSYEAANRCVFGDDGATASSDSSFYTISRVVFFTYDLQLPKEFLPTPMDGEVEEFFLWTVDQIKESMAPDYADPLKPNCYLVIIDYLVRRGYVSPDTPGYLDVLQELRSGDCR